MKLKIRYIILLTVIFILGYCVLWRRHYDPLNGVIPGESRSIVYSRGAAPFDDFDSRFTIYEMDENEFRAFTLSAEKMPYDRQIETSPQTYANFSAGKESVFPRFNADLYLGEFGTQGRLQPRQGTLKFQFCYDKRGGRDQRGLLYLFSRRF